MLSLCTSFVLQCPLDRKQCKTLSKLGFSRFADCGDITIVRTVSAANQTGQRGSQDSTIGRCATVIIAKSPVAGNVKTRLCPPLTLEQAAIVAEAALLDTFETVGKVAGRRVVALDGASGDWIPAGFEVVDQGDGLLGNRLAHVLRTVGVPVVIIAMDTPQITVAQLDRAHQALTETDTVFGPTEDGGYWLVGLSVLRPEIFDGVAMSTEHTFRDQRDRVASLGLTTTILEPLRDVDNFADCQVVAELIPDHRFGRTVSRLLAGLQ